MTDVNKDLNRLWIAIFVAYTLILLVSIGAFLALTNIHHRKLANSFAMSARSSLAIHDLRQAIMTLNPGVGDSFDLIEFRSPEGQSIFTLPTQIGIEGIKSWFTSVRIDVAIYEDPEFKKKDTLGTLVFYYDASKSMSWLLAVWIFFLILAVPIFSRSKGTIEKRHREILLLRQFEVASSLAKQVAHDIRSPVSALKIISQRRQMGENEFDLIANVTERIIKISEDLLENSRQGTRGSYQELVEQIKRTVAEKMVLNPAIEISIHDVNFVGEAMTPLNSGEWARIVSNLIDNSIQASDVNACKIEISMNANQARFFQFKCVDHGKGIPKDVLAKILKSGGSFGKNIGNGLGLNHLKRMVDAAGGSWKIDSTQGSGTTVTIKIPFQ